MLELKKFYPNTSGQERFLITSYFTDKFYLREAFELARTCQHFGLDYLIRQVPDLKSWSHNTGQKPIFLNRVSEEFPGRTVVWLDADARVRAFPLLFERPESAVGYHVFRGMEVLSGTVVLPTHGRREELLKTWAREIALNPMSSDQVCLNRAVKTLRIVPWLLPIEYCWIYDLAEGKGSMATALETSPVIEHMQASRWAKKIVEPKITRVSK